MGVKVEVVVHGRAPELRGTAEWQHGAERSVVAMAWEPAGVLEGVGKSLDRGVPNPLSGLPLGHVSATGTAAWSCATQVIRSSNISLYTCIDSNFEQDNGVKFIPVQHQLIRNPREQLRNLRHQATMFHPSRILYGRHLCGMDAVTFAWRVEVAAPDCDTLVPAIDRSIDGRVNK